MATESSLLIGIVIISILGIVWWALQACDADKNHRQQDE